MWNDKLMRLQYVDIATKEVVVIDQSDNWEITEFDWSPDSRWITYARPERETMSKIILYNTISKGKTEVTDGWYDSDDPSFSTDGSYLLFTSARTLIRFSAIQNGIMLIKIWIRSIWLFSPKRPDPRLLPLTTRWGLRHLRQQPISLPVIKKQRPQKLLRLKW
ncbi:MAG: hypothetical protein U5L72_19510, partial [Bacteroidales bacterium]|nr:hypothetical protein [Bacteroidales bacterium]